MLYTIAVILLVAWLLGFMGIYTIGSFVHVLLVFAIVLFVVGLISGRRVLGEQGRIDVGRVGGQWCVPYRPARYAAQRCRPR